MVVGSTSMLIVLPATDTILADSLSLIMMTLRFALSRFAALSRTSDVAPAAASAASQATGLLVHSATIMVSGVEASAPAVISGLAVKPATHVTHCAAAGSPHVAPYFA